MKKGIFFLFGLAMGVFAVIVYLAARYGLGTNAGSEFYGSEFAKALEGGGCRGIGNNSGSKFYGDEYIKAKYKNEN